MATVPPETSFHITPKLYALLRMRMAIDRAIACPSLEGKEKAARWAARWGEAAGIPNETNKSSAALRDQNKNYKVG